MAYTTIDLPTEYFNTVLYTGNSGLNLCLLQELAFKPDWVWFKRQEVLLTTIHYLML
jgi:hypothetical protein